MTRPPRKATGKTRSKAASRAKGSASRRRAGKRRRSRGGRVGWGLVARWLARAVRQAARRTHPGQPATSVAGPRPAGGPRGDAAGFDRFRVSRPDLFPDQYAGEDDDGPQWPDPGLSGPGPARHDSSTHPIDEGTFR